MTKTLNWRWTFFLNLGPPERQCVEGRTFDPDVCVASLPRTQNAPPLASQPPSEQPEQGNHQHCLKFKFFTWY